MRQESTGKPDPERASASEPAEKRGFFAAAGAKLKRVIGGRTEPPAAPAVASAVSAVPALSAVPEDADAAAASEVLTSVQARARELLSQDRAHRRGRARDGDERPRRTNPPPLPSQRTAALDAAEPGTASELDDSIEQPSSGVTAIPPARLVVAAAAKRPVRDSKSGALRARLGAAKAALAQAQAKRAAESDETAPASSEAEPGPQPLAAGPVSSPALSKPATSEDEQADSDEPEDDDPEIELEFEELDELSELQPMAATLEADDAAMEADASVAPAAGSGDSSPHGENGVEPIRTLTIARLLARQGYFGRSLSIYDELLAAAPSDPELRAEAEKVRAKKRSKKTES